jgi:hypothetical protein
MSSVEIDEQVHEGQAEILTSDARFRIVACGRRWGKTVTCAKETRDDLLRRGEGWLTWWVAPTYQQAEIGLRTLLDETPERFIADVNRSKLRVESVTGAVCAFKSADKPDNLRGEGVDKLVVDEAPEIEQYAYENALRPTLTDSDTSRMVAIGTPKGRGWFFEFFQRGKSAEWPAYESFHGPTTENPFINQDDVTDAERELPERVFRQEYLAEFVDETGGVFENLEERVFTGEYDLPESGVDPAAEWVEPPFSTGVDFARHQDYRVTVTLDSGGRVVHFERGQHEAWPQIQAAVERTASRYPGIVSVDASRDNKIVADLEAAGVDVRAVKFSASRKTELIENLITAVEQEGLTAPADETQTAPLRSELEVFEYDVTRSGNVRYHAPETHHDDTVDALALALDGRREAAKYGASATASVGREEYGDSDGDALREAVAEYQEQHRRASKSWK